MSGSFKGTEGVGGHEWQDNRRLIEKGYPALSEWEEPTSGPPGSPAAPIASSPPSLRFEPRTPPMKLSPLLYAHVAYPYNTNSTVVENKTSVSVGRTYVPSQSTYPRPQYHIPQSAPGGVHHSAELGVHASKIRNRCDFTTCISKDSSARKTHHPHATVQF